VAALQVPAAGNFIDAIAYLSHTLKVRKQNKY